MSIEMKYFVLKPRGDDAYAAASREAMCAYAEVIEECNPSLAVDLRQWARREEEYSRLKRTERREG